MNDPKSQQEPSMEEILASIRRIISEDDAESDDAPPDEAAADEAQDDVVESEDDVLELTEPVDDDESQEADSGDDDPAPTDGSDLIEVVDDVDEPEPEPVAEPSVAVAPPPLPDDGLISPPPAGEATSRFSVLAAAVAADRMSQSMGIGARTIEDLVKEVMRPMIKEWLDAHLPALTERMIGREIDRMARRAEDDIKD